MSTGKIIARAAIVILVINLTSKILGFFRDMVIAYQFGATGATDAYLVAYTIPYVLMNILALALSTVVVPVFSEYESQGRRDEAWKLFSTVTNLTALAFAVLVAMGLLGTPWLVKIIGPGLAPEVAALTEELTRIMLPLLVFNGVSTLFNGLLNANNIFAVPALSTVIANTTVIVSTLTLGNVMGIQGVAIGTVLGVLFAALFQLPSLWRSGFKYRFSFDWRDPGVQKVMSLMLPVTLGVSINQIYIVIDRMLASGLAEGSISALNYANKLILLPLGLFVMAIGTAFYPTLTKQAVDPKAGDMATTLQRAFRAVVMLSIPAGVGLMVLRYPIVQLLFERGEFDAHATAMTAYALLLFSIGLVGQSANVILTRGFYALQDTRTPVKLTLITVVINLIFSLLLIGKLQHGGLALANSIAALTNTLMLSWFLSRRVKKLWDRQMVRFGIQVLAASGLMAVVAHYVNGFAAAIFAGYGTIGLAIQVALAISAGILAYILAAIGLRIDETKLIFTYGKKFLVKLKRA
ncbi:murein biosynthesis integral membrane protein MurJ [Peptococcaceae bacterium 1198_IL3148]